MKYVSAEYIPPAYEGATGSIKAIGDDGVTYWIPSVECDVPPFPAFLESEEGEAFLASLPPEAKPADG